MHALSHFEMSAEARDLIARAMDEGNSILVSGRTGSGTTLLVELLATMSAQGAHGALTTHGDLRTEEQAGQFLSDLHAAGRALAEIHAVSAQAGFRRALIVAKQAQPGEHEPVARLRQQLLRHGLKSALGLHVEADGKVRRVTAYELTLDIAA